MTYAPDGGFFEGDDNGGTAFTHGVQIGVAQGGSGNLQRDTEQLVQSFSRSNPELRAAGNARRETIGGRTGLTTPLSNVSSDGRARIHHAVDHAAARRQRALHHWRRAAAGCEYLRERVPTGPAIAPDRRLSRRVLTMNTHRVTTQGLFSYGSDTEDRSARIAQVTCRVVQSRS